ncbi:hypothetical protein LP419_22525 [Massilia sp. H-1]|nr:hypothetical protein LP419_22525 [Massilia sp. H-1]
MSAILFSLLARRLKWDGLRWLSVSAWFALTMTTVLTLTQLYLGDEMPGAVAWTGFAAAWLASEFLLRFWPAANWKLADVPLKLIHLLRTAGPWIMVWKTGELWIAGWLTDGELAHGASWSTFVLSMGDDADRAVADQTQRQRAGRWRRSRPGTVMRCCLRRRSGRCCWRSCGICPRTAPWRRCRISRCSIHST